MSEIEIKSQLESAVFPVTLPPLRIYVSHTSPAGKAVLENDVKQGIREVIFIGQSMSDLSVLYKLAATVTKSPITSELFSAVELNDFREHYPYLFIKQIRAEELACQLCDPSAPLTAFVDARSCSGQSLAAAGGTFQLATGRGYMSVDDPEYAQAADRPRLRVLLLAKGVERVVFSCDHSISRGPLAATLYWEALRASGDQQQVCILAGGFSNIDRKSLFKKPADWAPVVSDF